MKAYLKSVRIAPKKANLVAKMVRGKPLHEAQEMLRCTNKRAARILEKLIRSAQANAEHNEKQSSSQLVVRDVIVNQGSAYYRSVPRARGRTRPIRKFLSHISVTLGVRDVTEAKHVPEEKMQKAQKAQKIQKKNQSDSSSQSAPKPVKRVSENKGSVEKNEKKIGSFESSKSFESSESSSS